MDVRQRIVIIDDNANDLAVTRRLLERRGYDVVTAQSGEDGLRVASQVLPDAIVVDFRMPGMDGFEVTRRVKSDPQLMTIPVLMLTGADTPQHVVDGLGAGADDFVTKGSDAEVLFARLDAQQRAQPRHDDFDVGALDHEVVGADAESVDDVLRRVGAGEHQHRNGHQLRSGLHPPRDLEAVQIGSASCRERV